MDMREIEQLHAHYAQPALTIDISPPSVLTGGAPLSLGGPVAAPAEPISHAFGEKWNRNPRVLWSVVFVVGAAAMSSLAAHSASAKRTRKPTKQSRRSRQLMPCRPHPNRLLPLRWATNGQRGPKGLR